MTEKKRYNIIDSVHTMPFIYDGDKRLAEVHSDDVKRVCDLLNKQDKQIKYLNHLLKQYSLFFDDNGITFNDFLKWLQNKTENKK